MNDSKRTPPGYSFAIVLGCLGIYFVIDKIVEMVDFIISLFVR